MFETLTAAPPDAILGLTEAWKKDSNPRKVNLGVGVFKDETGATPILKSVKAAEQKILENASSKSYMPIGGDPDYGRLVREMLLGGDHELLRAGRARSAHTPGGTAALRVGADFIRKFRPQACVWLSRPTWANHRGVFSAAGLKVEEYPYYDPKSHGLEFSAMMERLGRVASDDVVLLHACCHNPTGVDLTGVQWREVAALAAERGWLPFLDFAYQGYGRGLEEDREGLLALAARCPELLVASSFSKNFGLYQDRTGALTLVAANAAQAEAAFTHVEVCIRVNYSNPPAHGGLVVTTILTDPALRRQWLEELRAMRDRIAGLRTALVDRLKQAGIQQEFGFIQRQRGMFSFSGLTDEQVKFLREKKSIYLVGGGRLNVAGITAANLDYVCASIAEALSA